MSAPQSSVIPPQTSGKWSSRCKNPRSRVVITVSVDGIRIFLVVEEITKCCIISLKLSKEIKKNHTLYAVGGKKHNFNKNVNYYKNHQFILKVLCMQMRAKL